MTSSAVASSYGSCVLSFKEMVKLFSLVAAHFYIPTFFTSGRGWECRLSTSFHWYPPPAAGRDRSVLLLLPTWPPLTKRGIWWGASGLITTRQWWKSLFLRFVWYHPNGERDGHFIAAGWGCKSRLSIQPYLMPLWQGNCSASLCFRTRSIYPMCRKPRAEMPKPASQRSLFTRQPGKEMGEHVFDLPPWRWGCWNIYRIRREGGLRHGERLWEARGKVR